MLDQTVDFSVVMGLLSRISWRLVTCVRAQYVAKAQYVTIVTYWAQNAKFDWIFKNSAQYVAKFLL